MRLYDIGLFRLRVSDGFTFEINMSAFNNNHENHYSLGSRTLFNIAHKNIIAHKILCCRQDQLYAFQHNIFITVLYYA